MLVSFQQLEKFLVIFEQFSIFKQDFYDKISTITRFGWAKQPRYDCRRTVMEK